MARCAMRAVTNGPRRGARGRAGRHREISLPSSGRVRGVRRLGVVPLSSITGLPVMLDVPSAGRLLGIGRTRAYRLAASGGFPCPVLRVGGTWRVPTAGVLAVLGLAVPGLVESSVVAPAGPTAVGAVAG